MTADFLMVGGRFEIGGGTNDHEFLPFGVGLGDFCEGQMYRKTCQPSALAPGRCRQPHLEGRTRCPADAGQDIQQTSRCHGAGLRVSFFVFGDLFFNRPTGQFPVGGVEWNPFCLAVEFEDRVVFLRC